MDARDERCLVRLFRTNRKTSLRDLTSTFNQNRPKQVSQRTAQRCLYRQGYHRRVVKKKVREREVNRKKRLNWCRGKMRWNVNGQWDKVIFSDESQVVLDANQRIFIWRRISGLRVPPAQRKASVMICGCITWHGVETITTLDGTINRHKYIEILEDNLWPVIARHFPDQNFLFLDNYALIQKAQDVENYKVRNNIHSTTWLAQSPDLNIIENV